MVTGPEMHAAVPDATAGPQRPSGRALWWLGGGGLGCIGCGCLSLLLVFVAWMALGIGAATSAGINCVPSDFPQYSAAVWGGWGYGTNGCVDTHLTFASSSDVMAFYSSKLSEKPWRINALNRGAAMIIFEHVSGQPIIGMLWLVDQGPFRAICAGFNKSPAPTASRRVQLEALTTVGRQPVCTGTIP